jgi:hypothetical protein
MNHASTTARVPALSAPAGALSGHSQVASDLPQRVSRCVGVAATGLAQNAQVLGIFDQFLHFLEIAHAQNHELLAAVPRPDFGVDFQYRLILLLLLARFGSMNDAPDPDYTATEQIEAHPLDLAQHPLRYIRREPPRNLERSEFVVRCSTFDRLLIARRSPLTTDN